LLADRHRRALEHFRDRRYADPDGLLCIQHLHGRSAREGVALDARSGHGDLFDLETAFLFTLQRVGSRRLLCRGDGRAECVQTRRQGDQGHRLLEIPSALRS